MLVTFDRPRRVDRYIDYFGSRSSAPLPDEDRVSDPGAAAPSVSPAIEAA